MKLWGLKYLFNVNYTIEFLKRCLCTRLSATYYFKAHPLMDKS